MRTSENQSLIYTHVRIDTSILLALPFPACIYDPASNIVYASNSFFNQEQAVSLLELLNRAGYYFLTINDIKILNHRIKIEDKLTTRRVYYQADKVKSIEINLSAIPGQRYVLFFFNEVWSQDTVLSKSVYIEELLHGISEGIGLIDENNTLTFCNRSFANLLEKNENEIMGQNLLSVVHPTYSDTVKSEIDKLHLFLESHFEMQIQISETEYRFILVNAIPRKNREGRYSGAFFTLMDITERFLIEQELIIAKNRAMESDRLKSSFLTNMSHEIRTPMNCIIGFSSMLKKTGLERKKRDQYLDIIISRGKHLMQILNDIIDITKIEENQILLNYSNCDLYDLFAEIQVFYENELVNLNKNEIKFIVKNEFPQEKSIIRTDSVRLHQIFSHIINNAVKFTDTGNIEVGYYLNGAQDLIFYVKDSGIGIPVEKQLFIFDRFRQADESFTRNYGGTGLGLAICKGLLNLLGGDIWVESDGMTGSVFYFSIPFYNSENIAVEQENLSIMSEKVFDWKGRSILIVEDDPTSFEYLSEVLLPTNCKIRHANNGTEALKSFMEETFDLVLLDIQLPEMDGYQIASAIRKNNTKIPIIAQTAYAMSDDKKKCLDAGCNDYITKPVQCDFLLNTINSFF